MKQYFGIVLLLGALISSQSAVAVTQPNVQLRGQIVGTHAPLTATSSVKASNFAATMTHTGSSPVTTHANMSQVSHSSMAWSAVESPQSAAIAQADLAITLTNTSPVVVGKSVDLTAKLLSPLILTPTRFVSTTIDQGSFRSESSMAIGTDGLPIVSYYDKINSLFKVAKCLTADCSILTRNIIDNATVADFSSMAIGADGLPVIAYRGDIGGTGLAVAKCRDITCTSAIKTMVDVGGGVGYSLSIGADGLPVISYWDFNTGYLRVAKCITAACTSAIITTIDDSNIGGAISLAVGPDGLPIVSYYKTGTFDLNVAKCMNISCTAALINVVDAEGNVGSHTALAIGADGLPVISYRDEGARHLKVAKCLTVSCTTAISTTVDAST